MSPHIVRRKKFNNINIHHTYSNIFSYEAVYAKNSKINASRIYMSNLAMKGFKTFLWIESNFKFTTYDIFFSKTKSKGVFFTTDFTLNIENVTMAE